MTEQAARYRKGWTVVGLFVLCAVLIALPTPEGLPEPAKRVLAVADLMATAPDDLDWAKPLVDEAAAELDRGGGVPGDEAIARIRTALDRRR